MLVRRRARSGPGMPRGWTALCLLSLLPSGFTNMANSTVNTIESSTPRIYSAIPTSTSHQKTTSPSAPGSISSHPVPQNSSETTTIISETTVNFTSTSGVIPVSGTTNSSVLSPTSVAISLSNTPANFSTSEMTLKPSMLPGNASDPSPNSTSPVTLLTTSYTSASPTLSIIKGEITCLGIKQVMLTKGICLELNETSSCEDFKKEKGEGLIQVLCVKKQAEAEASVGVCSLRLAQSEISPRCLMLVLDNRTELSNKLGLMKMHQSDLRELGIHDFTEQNVANHQSYSRKTLIALVTSGILLAALGTTGYFLMNRRSWSPTGERLELEP
ncbi:hematopoietic progenitor cell antigen CD34 isoform X2 [Tupaia chinensis]|uniref:hematopoietic progenitor cell antigen CD34 isoform X2 n=1 Tax=Tupaia chinensis TaxID=246437 RepID=UPI0003C8E13B|nr:hematopoietic progenitor cell antigen CD34 isoform X2 [Tupaia chinensis]